MSSQEIDQESMKEPIEVEHRHKIPGDSPFYHHGDPNNDIWSIASVDLDPKPIENKPFTLTVRGELLQDIGPKPQWQAYMWMNGTYLGADGPGSMNPPHPMIDYRQPDREPNTPLVKGPLTITAEFQPVGTALIWAKYTFRMKMWATNGDRIADIIADMWFGATD